MYHKVFSYQISSGFGQYGITCTDSVTAGFIEFIIVKRQHYGTWCETGDALHSKTIRYHYDLCRWGLDTNGLDPCQCFGSAQADQRLCCPLITKQIFILASLWSWTDRYPNSQDKFSRGIHNLCLRAAMILAIKLIHFKCMRQIYVLYMMYCCEIKFMFGSVC